MTDHTSEPWTTPREYKLPSGAVYAIRIFGDHGKITVHTWKKEGDQPCVNEARANARLIAAAPDLLAALEATIAEIKDQIYSHCEDVGIKPSAGRIDSNKAVVKARAAIAKAHGKGDSNTSTRSEPFCERCGTETTWNYFEDNQGLCPTCIDIDL